MVAHSHLHRSRRAVFPHWALASGYDAKSHQGIGVRYARGRQPAVYQPPHPIPIDVSVLVAPGQRAVPESADLESEGEQGVDVSTKGVFVTTSTPPKIGSRVVLELSSEDNGDTVSVPARVVRVTDGESTEEPIGFAAIIQRERGQGVLGQVGQEASYLSGRTAQILFGLVPRLWSNWVTVAGTILVSVSGWSLALVLAASLFAPDSNPYSGASLFLVMPPVFAFGLALIPIGLIWERRRKKKTGAWGALQAAFATALNDRRVRIGMVAVGLATLINIAIFGVSGHRAVVYADSVEFCGTQCHTVMQPEYEAYIRSPHQRVACVGCHIGSGASWVVKSKISGLRQVWAAATWQLACIDGPTDVFRDRRFLIIASGRSA